MSYQNAAQAQQSSYIAAASGTLAQPPQAVTIEIIGRLDQLYATSRDILVNQRNLIERLHGAEPVNPTACNDSLPMPSGTLNQIENVISRLSTSLHEILEQQQRLDRLA